MDIYEFIIDKENIIRMSFFFGMLVLMGAWELLAPRRIPSVSKASRWFNNLGLVFLNSLVLRFIFPLIATSVALLAHQKNWGVLNFYGVSELFGIFIFVIVMDLVLYIQHILVHAIPLFWRFHRVHHADLDYDTTTGIRFHTFEMIFSNFIKLVSIVLLGPPIVAVIFFEIILNVMAMFNHGNVGLPRSVDRVLRWFIVTPDMHRIHHSVEEDETNSNFGFNLSIWDRIFGTYKQKARLSQTEMIIGIKTIRRVRQTNNIIGMLLIPFIKKIGNYSINETTTQ